MKKLALVLCCSLFAAPTFAATVNPTAVLFTDFSNTTGALFAFVPGFAVSTGGNPVANLVKDLVALPIDLFKTPFAFLPSNVDTSISGLPGLSFLEISSN